MREAFEAEDTESVQVFEPEEIVPYVPKFMGRQEEGVNIGALRGTAVHRMLECYDFTSEKGPREQLEELLENNRMTQELSELLPIYKIEKFVYSQIGKRMKKAALEGKLYREKPFVMGFTEKELMAAGFFEAEGKSEDLTLIQGMIDVFWIEEDGIVLLDYKTDSVTEAEELIARYGMQLKLYEEALNRVFASEKLRVKEKFIYAFKFGAVLKVE